jgi:hypothetical protein
VVLGMVAALIMGAGASMASAAGAALPDGRGYELVSPAAKNGIQVIPQTDKHHVAPDGNAVTFSALGGFASPEGSSLDFEYLSQRTGQAGTSGWSTRGINPLARATTYPGILAGDSSTFVDGFTPDVSTGIYATWRPLTNAPNVADVSNLYRVTGLAGGARTVQLMSDAVDPLPATWFMPFPPISDGRNALSIVPAFVGASSDLSHVVFQSELDLTADAPPYPAPFCAIVAIGCPTKLYENADGVVRLVGRIPQSGDTACDDGAGSPCVAADSSQAALDGEYPYRLYSELAVSRDGRRIYFQVPAHADSGAIYLREDGVRTDQVAANGQFWTASADGSRAFFTTSDSLVPDDTDGSPDLYMYDREAPAGSRWTLVSIASPGHRSAEPGYVEAVVGSSPDGHFVYFVCDGELIAGGPPVGILGLYAWHDGQLSVVGRFDSFGEVGVNTPRTTWSFIATARRSRITPDGRHLLFATTNDAGFVGSGGFTGYDQAGHQELYLYDADTGRVVCASCNPSGRPATSDALIDERDNAAASQSTPDSAQALTDDGRRVFFNTAEALVPEDTNGRPDAYEYDVPSGTLHLLSSGKSTAPSYFVDATANGDDVYIVTRERLVGWDVDDSFDLYDVRVNGGFPEPPTPAVACDGEGCRGQATPTPSADPFANSGAKGAGDSAGKLRRHRRCGRRAVLRKVRGKRRCVRRRVHRRAHRAEVRVERSGR